MGSRDAFGVTRGSYQYVDANGVLQTTHYISDPVNGFRVAATNLPVAVSTAPEVAAVAGPLPVAETPEVAAARAAHLAAHADAKAAVVIEPAVVERKKREAEPIQGDYEIPAAPVLVHAAPVRIIQSAPFVQAAPAPLLNAAPLVQSAPAPLHNAAPLVQAAPAPILNAAVPAAVAPVPVAIPATPSSQFHAQDEFGQFNFGYQNINSNKQESRDAFGVTRGSYQYVDANGVLQTTHYISDPVNGFRV